MVERTYGGGKPCVFFFSSRRRHTRCLSDWSSDVCSSDRNSLSGDHGCPPASRVIAVWWWLASSSMPRYWRPVRCAATHVEPEPQNGSKTSSPGCVKLSIKGFRMSMDFWVGCSLLPVYVQSITSGKGEVGRAGRPLMRRKAPSCRYCRNADLEA